MAKKKVLLGSIIGVFVIGALVYGSYIIAAPKPSEREQWLDNPTLDSPISPTWFWKYGTEGDTSDIDYIPRANHSSYRILGEQKITTVISGIPNSSSSPGWGIFNNSNYLLPDDYEIRSYGCWVYHYLDETIGVGQVHNFPSIHFKKNVSMPTDMSDYIITDASLEVIFNASVNLNIDSYYDWNQTSDTGFIDFDKFLIGDSANFYVELSDLNNTYPFRVGNFETRDVALGQGDLGSYPEILNITDSDLNYVDKQDLIAALNSVLTTNHKDFTITLGLDIYCEDNNGRGGGDRDEWEDLIFKSCTINITYERKIDYFTSLSLNQEGEEISGTNIRIKDANLNFKYKINDTWPELAPLSEIRIYFNNILYDRAKIKLSSANTSFQDIKIGGYDVTNFININSDLNLSIQVYLADTFILDKNLEISIDDVELYIIIEEYGQNWTPIIIVLSIAIISLVTVFTLYFKIFQFPPLVRKIRKLRMKIRKGRKSKQLNLERRDGIISTYLQESVNKLEIGTTEFEKEISFNEVVKNDLKLEKNGGN